MRRYKKIGKIPIPIATYYSPHKKERLSNTKVQQPQYLRSCITRLLYYFTRRNPIPKRSTAARSNSSRTDGSAIEIRSLARSASDLLRRYTIPCSVAIYCAWKRVVTTPAPLVSVGTIFDWPLDVIDGRAMKHLPHAPIAGTWYSLSISSQLPLVKVEPFSLDIL